MPESVSQVADKSKGLYPPTATKKEPEKQKQLPLILTAAKLAAHSKSGTRSPSLSLIQMTTSNAILLPAYKVITDGESGYVPTNKSEILALVEGSLVVIPGGASQGVWVATKVNNQSLQLCGAIDAQNKPLASCNASNKFTMRFDRGHCFCGCQNPAGCFREPVGRWLDSGLRWLWPVHASRPNRV